MATGQRPNEGRFTRSSTTLSRGTRRARRLGTLTTTTPGVEQYGVNSQHANLLAIEYFWGPQNPTVNVGDTTSAADAHTLSATLSSAETATGVDSQSIAVTLSSSETGAGADAGAVTVPVAAAETSSGADAHTLSATLPGTETSSGADTHTLAVALSGAETGAGVESQSITVTLSGAETGAGADGSALSATLTGTDTGAGADAETVDVGGGSTPVADADTGAGVDAHSIVVTLSGDDTSSGADAHSSGQSLSEADVAVLVDDFVLDDGGDETIVTADALTATESHTIYVTLTGDEVSRAFDRYWIRYTKDMTQMAAYARGW